MVMNHLYIIFSNMVPSDSYRRQLATGSADR